MRTTSTRGAAILILLAYALTGAARATSAPAGADKILLMRFHPLSPSDAQLAMAPSIAQAVSLNLARAARGRILVTDSEGADVVAAVAAGRQTGARFVVIGSYASVGQLLRISGVLVDVSSETAIAGLKATGPVGEAFAVEDHIAAQVRRRLGLTPMIVIQGDPAMADDGAQTPQNPSPTASDYANAQTHTSAPPTFIPASSHATRH